MIAKGVCGMFDKNPCCHCKNSAFRGTCYCSDKARYETGHGYREEVDRRVMANTVTVRWIDGYLEEFKAEEVRFGSDLLWMRLESGANRHIPLRSVRWFGMTKESHQRETCSEDTRR